MMMNMTRQCTPMMHPPNATIAIWEKACSAFSELESTMSLDAVARWLKTELWLGESYGIQFVSLKFISVFSN